MTREQYITRQTTLQNRLMRAYLNPVQNALQQQVDHAKATIRKFGVRGATGQLHGGSVINKQIGIVVHALYKDAAQMASKKNVVNKKAGFGDNTSFIDEVMQYLDKFLLDKVVLPITQTMTDEIETLLQQALSEGWGVEETVNRLDEEDIPRKRSRLIVRTESIRALNYTQLAAADNEFFEVDKQWIAIEDRRTRHSHRMVDGERRPLADPFTNGLMFPGDPEAGPAEVCNCRCTLGYFSRRDLNGKLVPKKNPGLNLISKMNLSKIS